MSVGIHASFNKFAFLHVQDSSDESETNAKEKSAAVTKKSNKASSNATNQKKKTRRRKKKHTNSTSSETTGNEGNKSQLKDWIRRDNDLVDELYDEDLKKALEQSKVEFEKIQSDVLADFSTKDSPHSESSIKSEELPQKEKKKSNKKSKALSLEEFHQRIERTLPLHNTEDETKSISKDGQNRENTSPVEQSNFFNEVEQEVKHIKRNEVYQERFQSLKKTNSKNSNPETKEKQNNRDKKEKLQITEEKDKIILELQNEVKDWEKQFKHVKKRNQQLLLMLQQGEMKGKCELLLEVESLGVFRDELTQEVATLNESLEQERSRSRKLKDELLKLQSRKLNDEASSKS